MNAEIKLFRKPLSPIYVNHCGRLSLLTGRSREINFLEDWEPGTMTLTVLKKDDASKDIYHVVGGCQVLDVNDLVVWHHAQTHRAYGNWTAVAIVPNTKQGLVEIRNIVGAKSVPGSGTWD